MARLFSAIVPSPEAVADLAEHVPGHLPDGAAEIKLRWTPPDRWHLTFGFFGDDDSEQRRTKWLHRRATGLRAPTLRLAGAGSFPGVLWIGVVEETAGESADAMRKLAVAAGAGRRPYRPHLTVARYQRGQHAKRVIGGLVDQLADYRGPAWTPSDLVLFRSDLSSGSPVYAAVHRVELDA
ncbi:2'-5' RNA ligase [Herbihabitans rhizosphaerae]|uniref:RNA 2',3'-cyclic phosphodiesterase n=1 Tax=Herbihabitans rhizosphaerae TaxID=1872711 RepID=A0A4Q7KER2_9PSEU|nr:RNA 2',3'-cyclic phosphodiesterase [Herbihabitans rhizosphaerae]RZS30540.1 2'-5' RNA ligase [Herbihabitans rhizosphaerae]